MKYWIPLLKNNIAGLPIPEYDDTFPSIGIELRYDPVFLNSCIIVESEAELPPSGWIYDFDSKTFIKPPIPEPEPEPEPEQYSYEELMNFLQGLMEGATND